MSYNVENTGGIDEYVGLKLSAVMRPNLPVKITVCGVFASKKHLSITSPVRVGMHAAGVPVTGNVSWPNTPPEAREKARPCAIARFDCIFAKGTR